MYFLSRHCVDQIKLASFSLLFSRKNTDCPLKVVAILVRERLNSFRLTDVYSNSLIPLGL